jgi:hypothetical protein
MRSKEKTPRLILYLFAAKFDSNIASLVHPVSKKEPI